MVPEKLIADFVDRLRGAAGANLRSVILYGSAARGEFVAEHSDINLLGVLGEISLRRSGGARASGGVVGKAEASPAALDDAQ
jgi:predicted nucleotidyltransferase